MSTVHVSGSLDFYRQLEVSKPGDTLKLHAGEYDGLDSYLHRIQGGTSWGTRTRIEAYQRAGRPVDRVVFRATAGNFCVHLAHAEASYLSIGTPENPIEVDGTGLPVLGSATAVKVTNAGAGCAHHVRLSVRAHHAFHHGILVTGTHHVELIGGSARDNGWTTDPNSANKDHGVYLGAGTWDCRVIDFDTSGNAAYGISEYGHATLPDQCGRNLVRGGFQIRNGRLALRAGILLSGTGSRVERVTSIGNQYGVHVYRTARGCMFEGYLEGNRDGRFYIAPEAIGCFERPAA